MQVERAVKGIPDSASFFPQKKFFLAKCGKRQRLFAAAIARGADGLQRIGRKGDADIGPLGREAFNQRKIRFSRL